MALRGYNWGSYGDTYKQSMPVCQASPTDRGSTTSIITTAASVLGSRVPIVVMIRLETVDI